MLLVERRNLGLASNSSCKFLKFDLTHLKCRKQTYDSTTEDVISKIIYLTHLHDVDNKTKRKTHKSIDGCCADPIIL